MKNYIILFLLLFSLITFGIPNYTGYINDYANILSDNYEKIINNYIIDIEKNTTCEIVILTVNDTENYTPKEYATIIFNTWKIGKKEKDNGLLILISMKDRRIEVETGYGLEGILPDSKIGRILDEKVVPHLKSGNYNEGIYQAVINFGEIIKSSGTEIYEENKNQYIMPLFFIFILLFPFSILLNFFKTVKCPYDKTKMILLSRKEEKIPGIIDQNYIIEFYKCPKCGYKIKKRIRKKNTIIIIGGIGGVGGGGFGGFGGGGSGGGGAGRGF